MALDYDNNPICYQDEPNSQPDDWPIITEAELARYVNGQNQKVSTMPDMDKLQALQNAGYRFLCEVEYDTWRSPEGLMFWANAGIVRLFLDKQITEAWNYYQNQQSSIPAIHREDWME